METIRRIERRVNVHRTNAKIALTIAIISSVVSMFLFILLIYGFFHRP
jgi:hypothetical protein